METRSMDNPFDDALGMARSMRNWRAEDREQFDSMAALAERVLTEADQILDPESRSSVTPQSVLLRFIVRWIDDGVRVDDAMGRL